jgi:bifunctional NMN adenylyltransferase/nudix hydrolase
VSNITHGSQTTRGGFQQDLCVYIGRFQPFHNGHLSVVTKALQTANSLVILVGSAGRPRDYFNPWSFEERKAMILASLDPALHSRVIILPIFDFTYNNGAWIQAVQAAVAGAARDLGLGDEARIALIGHSKDASSFYLKLFPQWDSVEVANFQGLSATPMREAFFTRTDYWHQWGLTDGVRIVDALPDSVIVFLEGFRATEAFANLHGEFEHIAAYKQQFAGLPYPPIFQTVDAVVIQSGHILLIQRRAAPGRNLWALPGGFLNANERIEDAVYRELREETRIKVPEPVLRGCTLMNRRFDDPHRSARGRTITDAFLIKLPDATELPKVKGSDDAKRAKWWPLADVRRDMLFEDHYAVISALSAHVP